MGMPSANVTQSTQPQQGGKMNQQPTQSWTGQSVTFPSQDGQPQMGMPNTYSNTVGQSDGSTNQPTQIQSGKGKGH